MNKYKIGLLASALVAFLASAASLKTWTVGETVTYSDLNANFSHIHTTMVGGHGPRLVNADVSSSAAISHSKLATPSLLPKVWGQVTCSGTCTATETSGVTSVTYTSAGVYVVNFAARTDANFAVVVNSTTSASADAACHGWPASTSTAAIRCITASTGAALESNFAIIIMDEE